MAIKRPEGTKDLLPAQARFWAHFRDTAFAVFGQYGYAPIETPIMELTDLFVRGIGEATDVVSKEMFTAVSGGNLAKLQAGEKLRSSARLSLRPEGTAGVVRAVAQHGLVSAGAAPVKLAYAGPMFRAERPQHGRQRQFTQVGAECLGAHAPTLDAEVVIMLMRFFERIGIPAQNMRLLVNSMGDAQCRPAYRQALHDYVRTRESQLCDDCLRRLDTNPLRVLDCKQPGCVEALADAPRITDHLCDDCASHYAQVKTYLDEAGIHYVEDHTLVRGLDYYTRTVFEVQCTTLDSNQNALGGGGRYDQLMEQVGGADTPGIGFAIGYERCLIALADAGVATEDEGVLDAFVATVTPELRHAAFGVAQALRDGGATVELDHQERSLKSQFKLADKLGARKVVVVGPDEFAHDLLTIRDMSTHEEQRVHKDAALPAILGPTPS